MLLVVGPVEEFSKFAVVRLKAYRSLYFDEPMDGLVYAAAASLGFASLENVLYVVDFGPEVMIVRAPVSTVAHLGVREHLGIRARSPSAIEDIVDTGSWPALSRWAPAHTPYSTYCCPVPYRLG